MPPASSASGPDLAEPYLEVFLFEEQGRCELASLFGEVHLDEPVSLAPGRLPQDPRWAPAPQWTVPGGEPRWWWRWRLRWWWLMMMMMMIACTRILVRTHGIKAYVKKQYYTVYYNSIGWQWYKTKRVLWIYCFTFWLHLCQMPRGRRR